MTNLSNKCPPKYKVFWFLRMRKSSLFREICWPLRQKCSSCKSIWATRNQYAKKPKM